MEIEKIISNIPDDWEYIEAEEGIWELQNEEKNIYIEIQPEQIKNVSTDPTSITIRTKKMVDIFINTTGQLSIIF